MIDFEMNFNTYNLRKKQFDKKSMIIYSHLRYLIITILESGRKLSLKKLSEEINIKVKGSHPIPFVQIVQIVLDDLIIDNWIELNNGKYKAIK